MDEGTKSIHQIYLEEYKIRVDYLNKHYQRLWNRFQFFITIELALFGFDKLVKADADIKKFVGTTGIIISLLWFFLSYQDRELVLRYKKLALLMLEKLAPELVPSSSIDPQKEFITDNYKSSISLTKFPMILPVIFLIVWIALLML